MKAEATSDITRLLGIRVPSNEPVVALDKGADLQLNTTQPLLADLSAPALAKNRFASEGGAGATSERTGTTPADLMRVLAAIPELQQLFIDRPDLLELVASHPKALALLREHPELVQTVVAAYREDPEMGELALMTAMQVGALHEAYKLIVAEDPRGEPMFNAARDQLRATFVANGGMNGDQLQAMMGLVFDQAVALELIPPDKIAEKDAIIAMGAGSIQAAVWIKEQPTYESWEAIADNVRARVGESSAPAGSAAWMREVETLTGTTFVEGNDVKSLEAGREFFDAVKDLIAETPAPGPIYLNYWAIYDDASGSEMVSLLEKLASEGYQISVIVDGKTIPHHGAEVLGRLTAAGIQLVPWNDPEAPPHGNHIKYIATPAGVVTGGSNIGDEYTHHPDAAEGTTQWSDANVRITGPATERYLALHESILARAGLPVLERAPVDYPRVGDDTIALVTHEPAKPTRASEHNILALTWKAMQGAEKSLRMRNAYFLMTEPMRQMITEYLKTGRDFFLSTNSPTSVDEKAVARAILDGAQEVLEIAERLRAEGYPVGEVKVFLEQGPTLHDKEIVVDESVALLKTYNYHPRSELLEHEIATVAVGDVAAERRARFDDRVLGALEVTSSQHPVFDALPAPNYRDMLVKLFENLL